MTDFKMNSTTLSDLPPLPEYTLTPRPSLVPGVSDAVVQAIVPIICYWAISLFFHFIDVYDIWPQYRLHTPAELLARNHATRWEVFRDVAVQQAMQIAFALGMTFVDPIEMTGREDYDMAVWAQRLRIAQRYIPRIFAVVGLDSIKLGQRIAGQYPALSGPLLGGFYPDLVQSFSVKDGGVNYAPAFALWEMRAAWTIYNVLIPAAQFFWAVVIIDAWQYAMHRGFHMSKFFYNTIHSRHHRLYVPYAYGALYNHPIEGLFMDILGSGVAYMGSGMTSRQGTLFFCICTFKTVDDHCGYALPWDPLQHISSNNAAYHDIHHQSWGIKSNFSQPFFIFWDRVLSTQWKGGDVKARYERARLAAQKKFDADVVAKDQSSPEAIAIPAAEDPAQNSSETFDYTNTTTSDGQTSETLAERVRAEKQKETEIRQIVSKTSKRASISSSSRSSESFRGLRDRVVGTGNSNSHGGRATILHAEGSH